MDHCIAVVSDLMEQARAAEADDVWPRSAFVQGLPERSASSDRPSRQRNRSTLWVQVAETS